MNVEWIGYFGILMIILSISRKSLLNLHLVNLVGCIVWIVYAVLSDTTPVLISNSIIFIISTRQIWLIKKGVISEDGK